MDYKQTSNRIIAWIKKTVYSAGFKKVVIGLSGGIDSALSATLVVKALGKENVFVLMLPYGAMSTVHVKDAKSVAEWLHIPMENQQVVNIKDAVDVIASSNDEVGPSGSPTNSLKLIRDDVIKGNVMARIRMIYLFDLAKKIPALVCGTENKTEHYLGYFTRFGDSASDIEPIQSFYKTQVLEMAKYLGIPKQIITKAPTAGLWERQTDEGEFGFTYKDCDQVLYFYYDKKLSVEQIVKKGISEEVVKKVLQRVKQNEFKHKLPYIMFK